MLYDIAILIAYRQKMNLILKRPGAVVIYLSSSNGKTNGLLLFSVTCAWKGRDIKESTQMKVIIILMYPCIMYDFYFIKADNEQLKALTVSFFFCARRALILFLWSTKNTRYIDACSHADYVILPYFFLIRWACVQRQQPLNPQLTPQILDNILFLWSRCHFMVCCTLHFSSTV